ncbi:DsbA family protein [Actinomadura sp. WAC 06369]|uniref:DsbA family protein n=1 Tax=Actinomadura sp. WAC 06369 TaxID=2203193 RepID=UPI000F7B9AA9|nr:thioredoxin domain-containing protein [Actinomadura sp. WAC 06369]RSN47013.1 disulfide bond formation protein DsbA [Actinomadura sp. WAC 06369]
MPSTTPSGPKSGPNRKVTVTAAAVLIAALVFGAVSAFGGGGGRGDRTSAPPSPSAAPSGGAQDGPEVARRQAGDPRAVGRADAPVVLIEYSDFQCPFCGKFARDVRPKLMRYVENGDLRIEWRDFPIFGAESEAAARAGYAAGLQGRFWEFHDVAYAKERKRNSGAFSRENLAKMAGEAGVPDLDRFRLDMTLDPAVEALRRDMAEGHELGVPSTPAFLINGKPMLGAQPFEVFDGEIRAALRQAEGAGR